MQQQQAEQAEEWVTIVTGPNGDINAARGQYWVMRPGGTNEDGTARPSEIIPVYSGGLNLFPFDGAKVAIKKRRGVFKIVDIDDADLVAAGKEPKALSYAYPTNRWVYLENVVRGKFFPVGSDLNGTSTLISMRGLEYIDADGTHRVKQLNRQSSKPDLASYIPSAGLHRLVMTFIRAYDNSIQIFGSTAQSVDADLDGTDVQECLNQSIINEDMPDAVFTLSDAQTSADMRDLTDDFRQWLNTPQLPGMPNPLSQNWHIRSTRHELVAAPLSVSGTLSVAGTLRVIDVDTPTSAVGATVVKVITSADSPYTLGTGYDVLRCDTTGGAIIVNLPALPTAQASRRIHIKNAGTNTLTITPNGGDAIDGVAASLVVNVQYDAPLLIEQPTEWGQY
jgi:hypothetical protein